MESVHPHHELNIICISHFSSQSSKNLRTQSKCPTPKNSCSVPSSSLSPFVVPSNIPVPPSPLAAPETTSFAPLTPVTPLRASRDLLPRQFRRQMGNHIPLCAMSHQAPPWHVSASLSSIRHIQATWIPTCRYHRIRILHGHRHFPTNEKLKDNRMTMRGEPTLPRNNEPMITQNYKTT